MLSRMKFVFVVALTIAALLVGTAQVNAALVASWALNESSGATTALDGTGSHPGTVGSSVTTGVAGGMFGGTCYNFAGGSFPADAVTVAEADSGLTGMTSMSMSVWVKATSLSGGDQLIMGVWPNGGPNSYGLLIAGSTQLDSNVYPGGTNVEVDAPGDFSNGASQWNLLTATWQSGVVETLYLNGVSIGTKTSSLTSAITATTNSFLMGDRAAGSEAFKGKMNDVGIWNSYLTAGEAAALTMLPTYAGGAGALAGYNSVAMNKLFTIYQNTSGTANIGGLTWQYATGLALGSGGVSYSGGNFYIQLTAAATAWRRRRLPSPVRWRCWRRA